MFKLIVFLKPYKKECILGPIFKLLEAILELLLPTVMALIINYGVAMRDISYVLKMGAVMVVMSILGFGSSMICQYYAARTSQGFGTSLRDAIFKHILSLSYSEIDKFGAPSLINRITNDVNQLQFAVAMLIRLVIRAPFICIGAIIMAMILDFKLALILIAATPVFAVILYFVISRASPLYQMIQNRLDKLASVLRENLSGVRVIRAFAKSDSESLRFNASSDDLTRISIHVGKISALLNPLTSLVMNASIIAILWLGGLRINSGHLSQGEIIAFVNYITQILLALIVVSNLVIIFTKAFASAGRVGEILAAQTSIIENPAKSSSSAAHTPAIEFRNASFGYSQTGDMALTDVSAAIRHGETVGIIGSTGSGKSTLINLIPRFYDVSEGEILVYGLNVKDYSLRELRKLIGIVPQRALLFTGTIAENIRWGKQDATDQQIIDAAKTAQVHEFISGLPDGYGTQVSRGGANFSGGQKQRLTIARALAMQPSILILDDSSSALDFATDAALRSSLKKSSSRMTVLIVSQRVSSIKHADKIIVLDDGRIAGIGTHSQLIDNCGVYKEICLSQLSGEEVSK
ncbi:ATP-binding cassette subfamily B protein [Anaerobacterium chartisolvens]|uniref:ATP-binding cassette subfamily B protein n=1 Tax=Anaerobacterium chartisolvens TaxID=1297424 RepID=A0A369AIZ1_9FIRM|nr:ABC transporter ATP-binding protein [Anaerobacterium chartisolvens]RCX09073.1 ATP-binding cassette subfamily B protein [Anaerobacterium chartisolvens]